MLMRNDKKNRGKRMKNNLYCEKYVKELKEENKKIKAVGIADADTVERILKAHRESNHIHLETHIYSKEEELGEYEMIFEDIEGISYGFLWRDYLDHEKKVKQKELKEAIFQEGIMGVLKRIKEGKEKLPYIEYVNHHYEAQAFDIFDLEANDNVYRVYFAQNEIDY